MSKPLKTKWTLWAFTDHRTYMMRWTRFTFLTVALLLVSPVRPCLADLEGGLRAYEHHDYQVAFEEFRQLAEHGDSIAQLMLGYMYVGGEGIAQQYAEAARWFREAADQGNSVAQFNLGYVYLQGQGVQQDDAEAERWLRIAANQGNATAQFNLGLMYARGQGLPKNYREAERWFRLAAEQGDATAQ